MKRIAIFLIFLLGVSGCIYAQNIKHGKLTLDNGTYQGDYCKRVERAANGNTSHVKAPHGNGIMHYNNGDTFEGEWADGKPKRGTYRYTNSSTFEGEWAYGKRRGTYTYTDGSTFVGEISVLKWKGTLTFKNNDNIAEGFDSWLIKAGNKFSGEVRPFSKILVDGEFSDEITNTKGDTFCGRIMSGKPSNGKFYYADTSRVKQWIIPAGCTFNGAIESFSGTVDAKIISVDGDIYTGQLKDGKPDGRGELLTAAGDRYTGNFSAGVLHGKGTVVFADGRTETGEWRNGLSPSEYDKMCLVKFDEYCKEVKEREQRKGVLIYSIKLKNDPADVVHGAILRLKQMFCGKKFICLEDEEKIYECIDITDDKITLKSESGEVIRGSIYSFYVRPRPHKKLSEYMPYPEDLEGVYQYYDLLVYIPLGEIFSIYPLADRARSKKRSTDYFINKYGYAIGMAVANREPHLGMTIEMIEDMFGHGRRTRYLSGNTEIVKITYGEIFESSTEYKFINNKLTSIYSY